MDAFEEIITALFEQEGYWTLRNYRVVLTKEQKRELKIPLCLALRLILWRINQVTMNWC